MEDSPFIKFLGTAGARFVVAKQLRASGGVYIEGKREKLILDPGPGTLVRCASSRPRVEVEKLTGIILTHSHIDHSNDVNVLIDAMTGGGLKPRGTLFAPLECLDGANAVVLRYLRSFLQEIVILEANREYRLGNLKFSTSTRHNHSAETYGIKFDFDGLLVSFLVDTKYFPGLVESYRDSDILVINVVKDKPFENDDIFHLTLEDVREILKTIKPRKAVLTHFGMMMLKAKPWEVAEELAKEFGVEVIAASDGMKLDLKDFWRQSR